MQKEQWDSEREGAGRHRRRRAGQPRLGALGPPQERDHRGAVPGVLQARGHDVEAPLAYTHARVEGRQEYTQLLYMPAQAPFDLWDREHRRGVKLYVRRVFIMDDAEQLMPAYLRFVSGVIDSNDLPLNVSREILQESKDVKAIRTAATKRVLAMLEELAEKDTPTSTQTFWNDVRPGAEGRHPRGPRQPRAPGQAAALLVHPPRRRRADRLAGRLRRPHEGRPGRPSTTSPPTATPRPATARSSRSSARRASRCCCCTTASTSGWRRRSHEFDGKPLQSAAAKDLDLSAIGGEAPTARETRRRRASMRRCSSGCRRPSPTGPARCG